LFVVPGDYHSGQFVVGVSRPFVFGRSPLSALPALSTLAVFHHRDSDDRRASDRVCAISQLIVSICLHQALQLEESKNQERCRNSPRP
jgi:hypothetical protein